MKISLPSLDVSDISGKPFLEGTLGVHLQLCELDTLCCYRNNTVSSLLTFHITSSFLSPESLLKTFRIAHAIRAQAQFSFPNDQTL